MVSRKIETTIAKNGLPVLQIEHEKRKLFIHSKYDPVKEAEQILSKYEEQIEQFQHVLFYGVGLGYHVKAFQERYPEKLASTYEPIKEVGEACSTFQEETGLLTSKLKFTFIESEQDDLEEHLNTFSNQLTQKVLLIVLPAYERILQSDISRFIGKFKEIVEEKKSNIGTNVFFSKRWTINSLMNLPSTFESPNFLLEHADTFQDKPIVLAAAGPSLSEEIDHLREIKEKGLAYIFAVGSANKALIAHGIHPDAVFTYDPQGHNASVYKELMDSGNTTIPMIYGTSVGFETIQLYPGPKFHFVTAQDTISQHFHETSLPVVNDAYSIAIVTLQILYSLQVKKVILVGQNFAFKNDLFYAQEIKRYDKEKKEVSDARVQKKDVEETFHVRDVFGNEILTNKSFNNMRLLMESYIIQNPEIPVINTTQGGAAILGTTYIPLTQLIKEELTDTIVEQGWSDKGTALKISEQTVEKLKFLQKDIERYPKQNEAIFELFYMIESSIDKMKEHQIQKHLERVDQLMRKLTSNTLYNIVIRPIVRNHFEKLQTEAEIIRLTKPTKEKLVSVVNMFAHYLHQCRNVYKDTAPIIQSVVLPKLLKNQGKKECIATSGVFHYEGDWHKKSHGIKDNIKSQLVNHYTAVETIEKNAIIKFRCHGAKLALYGTNHTKGPLKLRVIIDNKISNVTIKDGIDEEQYGSFVRKKLFDVTNLKENMHDVSIEITSNNPNVVFQGIEIDQEGRAYHIDEVTTVKDLEIGKRIRCHYESSYNTVGQLTGFGEETRNFLPIEASANPRGDFYFIMVDKIDGEKKLIADRNLQNYISFKKLENEMKEHSTIIGYSNSKVRLLNVSNENAEQDEWLIYIQGSGYDGISVPKDELVWNYERNVDEGRGLHSLICYNSNTPAIYSKYYNSEINLEGVNRYVNVSYSKTNKFWGLRPMLILN